MADLSRGRVSREDLAHGQQSTRSAVGAESDAPVFPAGPIFATEATRH
jgi:hypothetical protein